MSVCAVLGVTMFLHLGVGTYMAAETCTGGLLVESECLGVGDIFANLNFLI